MRAEALPPMRWQALDVHGAPPTIKNHTATAISRTELLVFGGYDGRRNHNDLYLFNSESVSWTALTWPRVQGRAPAGRNGHTATLAARQLVIIGGWLGSGPLAADDTHILDVDTMTWSQPPVRGTPPGPCNMHTADFIPHLNSVLVFRGGDGREYLNDLHALDMDSLVWRRVAATGQLPVPRANHSSALVHDDQLVVFGGWDGHRRLNDIHVLDTRSFTWSAVDVQSHSPLGASLPHPRAGMTFVRHRDRLVLFGGSGPSWQCYNDLHMYDPDDALWLDVTAVPDDHQLSATMQAMLDVADDDSDNDNENDNDIDNVNDGTRGSSLVEDSESSASSVWTGARGSRASSWPSALALASASRIANPNDTHTHRQHGQILVVGRGPGRRAGHSCAVLEERKLFVFGGSYGNEYLNDIYMLDTDPPPRATISCTSSPAHMLQHALRGYVNSEAFSDISFRVEGRVVYAHKLILSLLSERFRGMFTGGFLEAQQREIVIPGIRYVVFVRMLQYLYTGSFALDGDDATGPGNALEGGGGSGGGGLRYNEGCGDPACRPFGGGATALSHKQRTLSLARTRSRSRSESFSSDSDSVSDSIDSLDNDGSFARGESHQDPDARVPCPYEEDEYDPDRKRAFTRTNTVTTDASSMVAGNDLSVLLELLIVADQFMLDHLKQLCERALQHAVRLETVADVLSAANQSNAMQLKAICMHFLRNHDIQLVEADGDEEGEEEEEEEEEDEEDSISGEMDFAQWQDGDAVNEPVRL